MTEASLNDGIHALPLSAPETAASTPLPGEIANPFGEMAIQGAPGIEQPPKDLPFTSEQRAAIERLARNQGLVRGIIALGTRNGHPDPEGLAQESLLRTARATNIATTAQSSYAYTTARRLCIDSSRKADTKRSFLVDPVDMATFGGAEHPHTNVASRLALRSLMSCLNYKQLQVVDAVVFRDLTTEQAAGELGMPVGTIKAHKRNALAALRRAITRQGLQREDLTA